MMHLHGLRALPALIVVVLAIASSACACSHHQFGCYGSCPGAASCDDGGGGCQCVGPPTPSPPSNSWRCINGQCQKGPGGIDKGSCLSACGPSKDLYKCINNTCVKNGTGVIKSVCGAVCGRTWILGALGESCHTVCGMSGQLCTGGDWGDGDQASLEAAFVAAGEGSNLGALCEIYSGTAGRATRARTPVRGSASGSRSQDPRTARAQIRAPAGSVAACEAAGPCPPLCTTCVKRARHKNRNSLYHVMLHLNGTAAEAEAEGEQEPDK
jgi:hypothetical protein